MGICVIALLVNAVSNLVKMDADEENTMAFLSRRFSEREQRRLAAQLVVRFCAFARARRARCRRHYPNIFISPSLSTGE
jgi:hypothetical protein